MTSLSWSTASRLTMNTDSGRAAGTVYYYTVKGVNSTGTGNMSSEASAVTICAAPTSLSATAGNTQNVLSWSAATGAASYNLYNASSAGGEGSTPYRTGITGTTYTDTGLANGTAQYYKVTAVNASGESPKSNEASATPVDQPPTVATAASASPNPVTSGTTTSLSVLGFYDLGESNLTYTWATTGTPPATVTYSANGTNAAKSTTATFTKAGTYIFTVTIADSFGGSITSSVTVVVNATAMTIAVSPNNPTLLVGATQLFSAVESDQFGTAMTTQPSFSWSATYGSFPSSGTYHAPSSGTSDTVTATDTASSVAGSASVTLTTPPPPPPPPPAPVLDSATAAYEQVTLSWESVTGATSYNVYEGTSSGSESSVGTAGNVTGCTETGLTTDTTYYFYVTAVGPGGESSPSNEASATPFATPPTITTVATVNGGSTAPITGTTASVSVTASTMDGPASNLTYTWAANGPSTVTFSPNGTNAASTSTATFSEAGTYSIWVTVTNTSDEMSTTSSTTAPVSQSPTTLKLLPGGISVASGHTWFFRAKLVDQFNYQMDSTATEFTVTSGTGSVSPSSGSSTLFSAPTVTTQETDTLSAVCGSANATASIQVTVAPPPVLTAITISPSTATLAVGGVLQFTAAGHDQNGNGMTPTGGYSWTCSGGGSIDAGSGVYFAGSAGGNVQISASSGSISDFVNLTVVQPVPGAPTNLAASAGSGSITLDWSAPQNSTATSYTVYRTTSNGPGLTTPDVSGTSYLDTEVTSGTTYTYVVSASNVSGEGPVSGSASATVSGAGSAGGGWDTLDGQNWKGTITTTMNGQTISQSLHDYVGPTVANPYIGVTSIPGTPSQVTVSGSCVQTLSWISGGPGSVPPPNTWFEVGESVSFLGNWNPSYPDDVITGTADDGNGDPEIGGSGSGMITGSSSGTKLINVPSSGTTATVSTSQMTATMDMNTVGPGGGGIQLTLGVVVVTGPNVSITAPGYNAAFAGGSSITVSAHADVAPAPGFGTLSTLTINSSPGGGLAGGGTPDANGNVSYQMTDAQVGAYTVYAEATYVGGSQGTTVVDSLPITFYVQAKSWQPTDNNNQGTITYGQIIAPQDQTQSPAYPSTVTCAANGSLNCAVSDAQDTDYWKLSPNIEGVQNLLNPVDDSGDLSYSWSGPGTFSAPASPSTNWTAPSTVTIGNTATLTCTITDNGDPIGPFNIGTKIDAPVTSSVTVKYVAGSSSSLTPSLTVQNCNQWNPNPAYVGDAIHGTVTSTLTPDNLDTGGSGATFVTYSWVTDQVYASQDGSSGSYVPFYGNYVIGWQQGAPTATFNAVFLDPGYYILTVNCTANVCDSSTGSVIASATSTGYVGGDAADVGSSNGGVAPQTSGNNPPPGNPPGPGLISYVCATDAYGDELIEHYADGTGTELDIAGSEDPAGTWTDYIEHDVNTSSGQTSFPVDMQNVIKSMIGNALMTHKFNPTAVVSSHDHEELISEVDDLRQGTQCDLTGLELLHGSKPSLGDVYTSGTITSLGNHNYSYNLTYVWNDSISPNFNVAGENIAYQICKLLDEIDVGVAPKSYIVRITWSSSGTYNTASVTGSGWPFSFQ